MKKQISLVALAAITAGTIMVPVAVAKSLPSVGCAIYKYDDTFMTAVRNSILKAAPGKANVEMVDSQNSQPTQNDKIEIDYSNSADSCIFSNSGSDIEIGEMLQLDWKGGVSSGDECRWNAAAIYFERL